MTAAKVFGLGFLVQGTSYFNLTLNYRAIAHEQYFVILGTDAAAVMISIFIVKRISNTTTPWTWQESGMVVGGALAGLFGTWLTRSWG